MTIRWIFLINGLEEQKFRVGMLMIDVFEKFVHVVPINGKKKRVWRVG